MALPLPAYLAMPDEPFDDDDLDAYVDLSWNPDVADDELTDPARHPREARVGNFTIDTDEKAEWAARKLAADAAERARQEEQFDAWLRQVTDARDKVLARLDARISVMDGVLRAYGMVRRSADEKCKTINLPSATIKTQKATKAVVHVAEGREADVIRWADDALEPDVAGVVVKTTRKVMVLELRKVVDVVVAKGKRRVVDPKSGEVVPGLYTTEPGDITATVTPKL